MAQPGRRALRHPSFDRMAAWFGFAGAVLVQAGVLLVACRFVLDAAPAWLPGVPAAIAAGIAGLLMIGFSRLPLRQQRRGPAGAFVADRLDSDQHKSAA